MASSLDIEKRQQQDNLIAAKDSGVEVGVFMLLDQQDSGFIKKGTENTPNAQQLRNPVARQVLRTSAYMKPRKKGEGYDRVETEYVYSAQSIESDKIANVPRNPMLDRIEFRQGMKVVVAEGVGKNLLNFLRNNSYNETFENRIPGVEPIWKEVFPEKVKEEINEGEFDYGDAIIFIRDTFTSKTKDGYTYDEDRLRAFCQLFDIAAETPAGRVEALRATAKVDPKAFLIKARNFEERTYQDIAHGVQLGILAIEPTRIAYVNKDRVLVTFSDKLANEEKVKKLAGYFMSKDGREEYNIFLTELDYRKNGSLNNN